MMSRGIELSFTIPVRKRVFKHVFQFRIELCFIEPLIWRRIQVPETCTFYDLHVAIQDAMGWEDRHLHDFEIGGRKPVRIECPFAEPMPGEQVQYWTSEVPLKKFLKCQGSSMTYDYDFGDGWRHKVVLEDVMPRRPRTVYPICLDGDRSCPPDCGGIGGYTRCMESLQKKDPEDEFTVWLGDWRPDEFDAKKVKFDDPRRRFLMAFDED